MRPNTRQLALDFDAAGAAGGEEAQGSSAPPARTAEAPLAEGLMEAVVAPQNVRRAWKRVFANQGCPGVDGMTVHELGAHLQQHWAGLREQLLEGSYRPQPVKRVEIPKPGGGVRQLGIPTVLDRFLQQALVQVLEPLFDPTFSEHSYGFRPGKSAHHALVAAKEHVASGKGWVVDLDLEKFFDRVNHDLLMSLLAKGIGDTRVLKLLRRYLQAGAMAHGVVVERHEGTPQGGPISPLLANLLLDGLDRELERRGHAFCRYADDCNIYVGSQRAGVRVMASVTRFLERKLRLRVNTAKSAVAPVWQRSFLGMRLFGRKEVRLGIAPASLVRCKERLRQITSRNRGVSFTQVLREVNEYTAGWVNYFALAEAKTHLHALEGWLCRKLRCVLWKQWKTPRRRASYLRRAGVGPWLVAGLVNRHGHGPWRMSRHAAMQRAVPREYLRQRGYQSLYERYLSLRAA
jgi:RNA-directed DNA polymerase